MRPPSLKETNALRRALLKETGDADDPVQALRIHRALSQGHIAVLPHVEVSPAFGHAPLYLVLWASLELRVFVHTAEGHLVVSAQTPLRREQFAHENVTHAKVTFSLAAHFPRAQESCPRSPGRSS